MSASLSASITSGTQLPHHHHHSDVLPESCRRRFDNVQSRCSIQTYIIIYFCAPAARHTVVPVALSFVAETSPWCPLAMLSASTNHVLACRRLPAVAGSLPRSSACKRQSRSIRKDSHLPRQWQQDAQVHPFGGPCRGRSMSGKSISCSAQSEEDYSIAGSGFEPESQSPPYAILLALAAGGIAETSYLTLVPQSRHCAVYNRRFFLVLVFVKDSQLVCCATNHCIKPSCAGFYVIVYVPAAIALDLRLLLSRSRKINSLVLLLHHPAYNCSQACITPIFCCDTHPLLSLQSKLLATPVACPTSGCDTVLSSGYAELYGIPLSAFGAHGCRSLAAPALQLRAVIAYCARCTCVRCTFEPTPQLSPVFTCENPLHGLHTQIRLLSWLREKKPSYE